MDLSVKQSVENYICSLRKAIPQEDHVLFMRRYWPERYFNLCKTQLSYLLDIPCDLLDYDSYNHDWQTSMDNNTNNATEEVAVDVVSSSLMNWMKLTSFQSDDQMQQQNQQALQSNRQNKLSQILSKVFSTTSTNKRDAPFSNDPTTRPLNSRLVNEMMRICEYLSSPENIKSKGLFRINGCHARVHQIKTQILDSTHHEITASSSSVHLNKFTVHDLACAVKAVLGDLGQSIFTTQLLPCYTQAARLTVYNGDNVPLDQRELDIQLAQAKQIKAIRILYLLLPNLHQQLVKGLFSMLHSVSKESLNSMSASSLGLLFAPHLLMAKNISSTELKDNYATFAEFIAFMIEYANELFMVPTTLSMELKQHWLNRCKKLRHLATTSCSTLSTDIADLNIIDNGDDNDDPLLHNAAAFVTRKHAVPKQLSTVLESADEDDSTTTTTSTEFAVAELFAQVQNMPDCLKKRQLIHKLNKTNGGLGSPQESAAFARATTTFGGLRSSIRKRMALSQLKSLGVDSYNPVHSVLKSTEINLNQPCDETMPAEPNDNDFCFSVNSSPVKKVRLQSAFPCTSTEYSRLSEDSFLIDSSATSSSTSSNNGSKYFSQNQSPSVNKQKKYGPSPRLTAYKLFENSPHASQTTPCIASHTMSPSCFARSSSSRISRNHSNLLTASPIAYVH